MVATVDGHRSTIVSRPHLACKLSRRSVNHTNTYMAGLGFENLVKLGRLEP